ncbi:transposase [Salmonella enterica]|uniref:transposase n=1 Tax=Salmonella enterica TaxID=28901 RepID=UPI001F3349FB|nr:transposase [Salmonella enterica]
MSVTCGGLNKHGQWKKLSFLKDAMRFTWMWNMRQLLLKSVGQRGWAMPESLSHITTGITVEKPGAEIRRKILACVHVEEDSRRAGIRHAYLGRYLKKPPIAASRLAHYNGGASLSFRYLDHKTGETATETLTQRELVASWKQHIPEKFFKMVRYFGVPCQPCVWREAAAGVPWHWGMDKPEPVAKVCYAQMVKQFLSRDPFGMRAVWLPDGIPPGHCGAECIRAEEKRAGYQSTEVYAGLTQAKCARESVKV